VTWSRGSRVPIMVGWLANFFANTATQIMGVSKIGALIVAVLAALLGGVYWHKQRFKEGKRGVEPSYLIWIGAIGPVISIAVMLAGVVWQQYGGLPTQLTQKTLTPGIGTAPLPHRETIQWNEIFGTTRAVDVMVALFLDGTRPEDKSIRLQDAFIESASHGDVIHMQVVGTDNPLDEPFPIAEANPVPPNGFIRLIAQMNPRATREGVPNKEFLERWRNIWFNVVYEDGKKDRISFDTSRYFPGLAGPHVTRKE
jgi:hypothetical protein